MFAHEKELELFDISPEVSLLTAVFPGDLPFQRKVSLDFKKGDPLLLSSIETTLHIGAHADAPNHYHPEGTGIGVRDLRMYLGRCQVISVSLPGGVRILPKDLGQTEIIAPRVLFKTDSFLNPNHWNGNFNSLSPELVRFLGNQGVRLVGIDTPSVDPAEDRDLLSHNEIYQQNMAVLEGIVLTDVPEGVYTLVALPLRIKDADASPVRAVLIRGKECSEF